jgi:hypothetical protein
MPDINRDIWKRDATPGVNDRDAERERNARLALGDVRPHELLVNVVRSDLLLGCQLATGCIRDAFLAYQGSGRCEEKIAARERRLAIHTWILRAA